jgi:hypothetical protein
MFIGNFWLSFMARRAEDVNEVNKRTNEKGQFIFKIA